MNDIRTLLIVDDDGDILEAIVEECKSLGYKVLVADDGEKAWQILRSETIHAVLTDVQMPGMSGNDLINKARGQGMMMPFVFMSGHSGLEPVIRAMRAGACDFMYKPILVEVLRKVVPRVLDIGARQQAVENAIGSIQRDFPAAKVLIEEIDRNRKQMGRLMALGAQGEWELI